MNSKQKTQFNPAIEIFTQSAVRHWPDLPPIPEEELKIEIIRVKEKPKDQIKSRLSNNKENTNNIPNIKNTTQIEETKETKCAEKIMDDETQNDLISQQYQKFFGPPTYKTINIKHKNKRRKKQEPTQKSISTKKSDLTQSMLGLLLSKVESLNQESKKCDSKQKSKDIEKFQYGEVNIFKEAFTVDVKVLQISDSLMLFSPSNTRSKESVRHVMIFSKSFAHKWYLKDWESLEIGSSYKVFAKVASDGIKSKNREGTNVYQEYVFLGISN